MTRFSERVGAQAMPRQIQVESMDEALQNSLWNSLLDRFHENRGEWVRVTHILAKYFFMIPVDTVPDTERAARKWMRDRFYEAEWYQIYDLVEYVVKYIDNIKGPLARSSYGHYENEFNNFVQEVNSILARELSGYRFVGEVLAPITDPVEVAAIERAANEMLVGGLSGAATHIRTALSMLGRKPSPDYRNSIKESVSAVESAANLTAGTDEGGVARAIEVLAAKSEIHPALRTALKQLYGYSSDADGIRHAILEQTEVGFPEAKFMLVACSAFVNFIVEKGEQARSAG